MIQDDFKKVLEKQNIDLKKNLKPITSLNVVDSEDIREKDLGLIEKELRNVATKNEIDLKKSICGWVKWVVSIYLVFIAAILFILVLEKGKLNDSVIIALLTTTTINILGLPLMIIKSLFPSPKNIPLAKIAN